MRSHRTQQLLVCAVIDGMVGADTLAAYRPVCDSDSDGVSKESLIVAKLQGVERARLAQRAQVGVEEEL